MVAGIDRNLGAHARSSDGRRPARASRAPSARGVAPRNGPPDDGQDQARDLRGGSRPPAPGRSPSARNRPGSPRRPPACAVRSSAGPAQTRLSLLASATMAPARAAARVGARPAKPTMADITHWASTRGRLDDGRGAGRRRDAGAGQALAQLRQRGFVLDHRQPAGASAAPARPAARRCARRPGRRPRPRPWPARRGRASRRRPSRWSPGR